MLRFAGALAISLVVCFPAFADNAQAPSWVPRGRFRVAPRVVRQLTALARSTRHARRDLPTFIGGEHAMREAVEAAWQRASERGELANLPTDQVRRVTVTLDQPVGIVIPDRVDPAPLAGEVPLPIVDAPDPNAVQVHDLELKMRGDELLSARPVIRSTQRQSDDPDGVQYDVAPINEHEAHALRLFQQIAERDVTADYAREHLPGSRRARTRPMHAVLPLGAERSVVSMDRTARIAWLRARGARAVAARRAERHLALGAPSNAGPMTPDDYLWIGEDRVASYNREMRGPNWESFEVAAGDYTSGTRRVNDFRPDPTLPEGWPRATLADYEGLHGPVQIGHFQRSAERRNNRRANSRTNVLSNTVPQAANNNEGPWNTFEKWYEGEIRAGSHGHVLVGAIYGANPVRIGPNNVAVPRAVWKVVVLTGPGGVVNENARVRAVLIPNSNSAVSRGEHWSEYSISIPALERETGLRMFRGLSRTLADTLAAQHVVRVQASAPEPVPATPSPGVEAVVAGERAR